MADMPERIRNRYIATYRRFLSSVAHYDPCSEVKVKLLEMELDSYADYLRRHGYRETTIASRKQTVTSIMFNIKREFGLDMKPEEVDAELLTALVSRMSGRLKESTLDLYVRGFLEYVDWVTGEDDYIGELDLRWNGNFSENAYRVWIDMAQLKKIRSVSDEEENLVLILGAGMGLRRSEIASLSLSDIDGNVLTIHGKGHGNAGKVVARVMPKYVQEAIKNYLPVRESVLQKHGDHSQGHLLVRSVVRAGFPMDSTAIQTIIDRLNRKSGVRFTCHSLRRLFATTAYQMTDLETLRQLMRHSNISTTFQCYIYADPARKEVALDAIGEALFGGEGLDVMYN